MTTPPLTEDELDGFSAAWLPDDAPPLIESDPWSDTGAITTAFLRRLVAAARADISARRANICARDAAHGPGVKSPYDVVEPFLPAAPKHIQAWAKELANPQPTEAIAEEGEIDHVHGIPYRVGSIKHKPAAPLCTCTPQFGQDPYCPEHSHYDPQPTEAIAEDGHWFEAGSNPGLCHRCGSNKAAHSPRPDAIEGLVEKAKYWAERKDMDECCHAPFVCIDKTVLLNLAAALTRLSADNDYLRSLVSLDLSEAGQSLAYFDEEITRLSDRLKIRENLRERIAQLNTENARLSGEVERLDAWREQAQQWEAAWLEAQSQLAVCRDLLRRAQAALITKQDRERKAAP